MIASDTFYNALQKWRRNNKPGLIFHGANVHPDLMHLVAAKTADRETLMQVLTVPGLPRWATSLTYDYPEPRLFPKLFAKYDHTLRWTQQLSTPFRRYCSRVKEPCYLHLKFCKRDPYSGYSSELANVISSNVVAGTPLSPDELRVLRRWNLES
jgi:hypothetical protein